MQQLLPKPLRSTLDFNAVVSRGVFRDHGLTPTYPISKAVDLRVNGNYGLKQDLLLDSYRLQVVGVAGAERMPQYVKDVTAWEYRYATAPSTYAGHDTKVKPKDADPAGTGADTSAMPPAFQKAFADLQAQNAGRAPRGQEEAGESDSALDPGTPGLLLALDHLTGLGRQELVTRFMCIEGWSEVVQWAGVPLRDFIAAYPPARNARGETPRYVYMETPNGDYYCGFDLNVCLHPQSTLVTEMSGKALTQVHGAPLRLHMPVKYGYKQIKRIGLIAYTDDKPDDYWTKLGYDWYAGI